jgi:hypothetical protein
MFKENLDRMFAFCVADFEPKVSHIGRQHAALEAVQRYFNATDWRIGAGSAVLQNQDMRAFLSMDLRRIFLQTLGFETWKNDDLVTALTEGLRELAIEKIRRLSFRTMVIFSRECRMQKW